MKASVHRPSKAVIDLAAIAFNIRQLSAHLPQTTEKWAVVKANAYGTELLRFLGTLSPL